MHKMVKVRWLTANEGLGEWYGPNSLPEITPIELHAVGFLVERTEQYVMLAQGVNQDKVRNILTIPAQAISDYTELSESQGPDG